MDDEAHKNIIIFHTDQQRFDCLGCNGNQYIRTPNIDSIASEGCIFTRHISSNPVCMPSRASLFTGVYPPWHNVRVNGIPLPRREYIRFDRNSEELIKPSSIELKTLADIFANNGYETAAFGKLHFTPLGAPVEYGFPESHHTWLQQWDKLKEWTGRYYGFDYVQLVLGHGEYTCFAGGHYSAWLRDNHRDIYERVKAGTDKKLIISKQQDLYPSIVPFELHNTNWLADRVCNYLNRKRDKNKPFFIFVGFPDPHHPFTPSYDIVKEFEDIDVHQPVDCLSESSQTSIAIRELIKSKGLNLSDDELKVIIRYTYAMLYQIDLAVGKIISVLKENDLWDDTIVLFTSDHGDWLGDHGLLYKDDIGCDSLLHTPLILKAPTLKNNISKSDNDKTKISLPVSNCDVGPTLLSLCGIDIPENVHGDDIITKLNLEDRTVFSFAYHSNKKLYNYTLYTKRYRFTYYPIIDFCELYDHQVDSAEINNIAKQNTKLCNEFIIELGKAVLKYSSPVIGRVSAW